MVITCSVHVQSSYSYLWRPAANGEAPDDEELEVVARLVAGEDRERKRHRNLYRACNKFQFKHIGSGRVGGGGEDLSFCSFLFALAKPHTDLPSL